MFPLPWFVEGKQTLGLTPVAPQSVAPPGTGQCQACRNIHKYFCWCESSAADQVSPSQPG